MNYKNISPLLSLLIGLICVLSFSLIISMQWSHQGAVISNKDNSEIKNENQELLTGAARFDKSESNSVMTATPCGVKSNGELNRYISKIYKFTMDFPKTWGCLVYDSEVTLQSPENLKKQKDDDAYCKKMGICEPPPRINFDVYVEKKDARFEPASLGIIVGNAVVSGVSAYEINFYSAGGNDHGLAFEINSSIYQLHFQDGPIERAILQSFKLLK